MEGVRVVDDPCKSRGLRGSFHGSRPLAPGGETFRRQPDRRVNRHVAVERKRGGFSAARLVLMAPGGKWVHRHDSIYGWFWPPKARRATELSAGRRYAGPRSPPGLRSGGQPRLTAIRV
jgi:hypothetical protein